ncbi:MAG: sigma-70 family RNA polymerase sigma factor [Tenacibaculum sp.]
MKQIKQSDHKAFQKLYNILSNRLFTRAQAITGDRALAEYIVQEVWVDLWNRKKEIVNHNIENFLLQATRFKSYNEYRNKHKRQKILNSLLSVHMSYCQPEVEKTMCFNEMWHRLQKAIDNLPEKRKQVFTLSRLKELKNNEISQQLGISKRTVENHISNALKSLKNELFKLLS